MKKTFTKNQIQSIAQEIIKLLTTDYGLQTARVVALSGDLGAGKTTLTQSIARELDIRENVISPTFVLIKNYKLRIKNYEKLVHIDAYRFDSEEELLKLGWKELISDPKNLILIEWPERVAGIIPKDAIRISLSHKDEETRHIMIR